MGNNATKQPQQQHHPIPAVREKHKKSVHWKTAERPSPPGRPMLFPSTENPDVIHIKWERPKTDGGSPLLGYIIECRRTGSSQWIRAVTSLVTVNEYLLSGLEPGWRYQFRIIAENVIGKSDASLLSDGLTVTLLRNTITVPRFVKELSDTIVVENSRVELRVAVVGTPAPEICWFKDGYEIFSSRRTKIVNENDSSVLIIHQAALTDEGEIKCTATNRAGHVVTKARLKVEAPPKIRLPRQYEDGIVVEADEVLRLKVALAGQPPPKVVWCHEGKVVHPGGRFELITNDKSSSLKISQVKRSDQGEYSLKAINKLGEDIAFILVTVTSRPTPPGKVQLSMSFGKSTRLTWTAPDDDGGCKVGNYIVEYYRVGWNVWLKAATTRQLETTLHDLIEGSQYKFRVKAENPYGLSDPSDESNILFVADPKRGIRKAEEIKGELQDEASVEEVKPPLPPKQKTLSPLRNFLTRSKENLEERQPSPKKQKSQNNFLTPSNAAPQIYESDTLTREMSYGSAIDGDETAESRRSPSTKRSSSSSSPHERRSPSPMRFIESLIRKSPLMGRKLSPKDAEKSPASSRKGSLVETDKLAAEDDDSNLNVKQAPRRASFDLRMFQSFRGKPETPSPNLSPNLPRRQDATDNNKNTDHKDTDPITPDVSPSLPRRQKKKDVRMSPNLERSQGPVKPADSERVNDKIERTSMFQSPVKPDIDVIKPKPPPPILIERKLMQPPHFQRSPSPKPEVRPPNPVIHISAPEPSGVVITTVNGEGMKTTASEPPKKPPREKNNLVHNSSEFMLVLYPNNKSKENEKQESFDLDLDEALSPPPLSLSVPDLSHEIDTLPPPMRPAFSSTELLYERAMARFYEAVELEEAERNKKRGTNPDQSLAPPVRKRLGSMSEAERLSFERRASLRKRLSGDVSDLSLLANPMKLGDYTEAAHSRRDSSRSPQMKREADHEEVGRRGSQDSISRQRKKRQGSEESMENDASKKTGSHESVDYEEDYTESTASSEDSIEKFKIEMMARTRTGSEELQTYHPRAMSATPFSPYRVPTPDQSSIVLSKPVPLASPDFVPKPILKRSSAENIVKEELQEEISEKGKEAKKGFMSLFKKEKSSSDQNLSKSKESLKTEEVESKKNGESNDQKKEPDKTNGKINGSSAPGKGDIRDKKLAAAEELRRKKLESRQSSEEETKAVADYYNDIVREMGKTRKSTVPIYLNSEELKKATEKAEKEESGGALSDRKLDEIASSEEKLIDLSKQKPRLSIVERMQVSHVKPKSSLAMELKQGFEEESDDVEKVKIEDPHKTSSTEHIASSSTEQTISSSTEQLVGAGNRARSARRQGKKVTRKVETAEKVPVENNIGTGAVRKRIVSRSRTVSKSPGPRGRKVTNNPNAEELEQLLLPAYQQMLSEETAMKSPDRLLEEAQVGVRSAFGYFTDVGLFLVACWIYLFKDAILVIPILLLLVYRQIGEAISNQIPDWMKRKRS